MMQDERQARLDRCYESFKGGTCAGCADEHLCQMREDNILALARVLEDTEGDPRKNLAGSLLRGLLDTGVSRKFLDRHHRPLSIGDKVRAKHCIGRYGETRTVTGTVKAFGGSTELHLVLDESTRPFTEYATIGSHPYTYHYEPGDTYTVWVFDYDPSLRALIGYGKFDDYEHGHECWVELLTTEQEVQG